MKRHGNMFKSCLSVLQLLVSLFFLISFLSDVLDSDNICFGRKQEIKIPLDAPQTNEGELPAGICIRAGKPEYVPTEEDKKRGFIVYRIEPFHWDRHNTIPANTQVTNVIKIFSAKGEYEPICIGIYALTNLHDVIILMSDLTNSRGNVIKGDNADIRVVYWWRQGNIMSSSLDNPYYLPELLVTDSTLKFGEGVQFPDKLVPINIRAKTNKQFWITIYVPKSVSGGLYKGKIFIKTGNKREISINIALRVFNFTLAKPRFTYGIYYMYPLQNGIDEKAKKQLVDIKRHGFDTVTLFYRFAAGSRSQVIEQCVGKIEIGREGKLTIRVKRSAFAGTNEFGPYLDRIKLTSVIDGKSYIYDFHKAKLIRQNGLISYSGNQFSWANDNNVYALNNARDVEAYFEFYGLPKGRFSVWLNGINAGRVMDISLNGGKYVRLFEKSVIDITGLVSSIRYIRKIGLNGPIIYFGGPNITVIQSLTLVAKRYNWNNVYFYAIDEPQRGKRVFDDCKRACELIHTYGGKSITATDLQCANRLADLLDIPVLTWQSVPEYSILSSKQKSSREYWTYWQAWMENPLWNRYSAGFMLWKSGFAGAMPFIYQQKHGCNAYDDFDYIGPKYGNRDFMCTYPSQTGPVPTIQWEALREGIDDARYLSTLLNLLENNQTVVANRIKRSLSEIKRQISPDQQVQLRRWDNRKLNQLRYKIANWIFQLISVKGK